MSPLEPRARRPRPAARAEHLPGPVPETRIDAPLVRLCHAGERAVTVAGGPGRDTVAVLGSPFDAEAFVTWRADGIQIFFRGPAPNRLDLGLDERAGVTAVAIYD